MWDNPRMSDQVGTADQIGMGADHAGMGVDHAGTRVGQVLEQDKTTQAWEIPVYGKTDQDQGRDMRSQDQAIREAKGTHAEATVTGSMKDLVVAHNVVGELDQRGKRTKAVLDQLGLEQEGDTEHLDHVRRYQDWGTTTRQDTMDQARMDQTKDSLAAGTGTTKVLMAVGRGMKEASAAAGTAMSGALTTAVAAVGSAAFRRPSFSS